MIKLGEGSFGTVYRSGRCAIKVPREDFPPYLSRVLYLLCEDIARHCVLESGELRMPIWGPTVWDVYADGPIPPVVADELKRCLCDQLGTCQSRGLIHCDVKGANIALTGAWPTAMPECLLEACEKQLLGSHLRRAHAAGGIGYGFVLIDLDAICPLNQIAECDRGTLCPYGELLQHLVKTPHLAAYAMWFAAAAVVAAFTPAKQIRCRSEFASQHEQLAHTGMLLSLDGTLAALDSVAFFETMAAALTLQYSR